MNNYIKKIDVEVIKIGKSLFIAIPFEEIEKHLMVNHVNHPTVTLQDDGYVISLPTNI